MGNICIHPKEEDFVFCEIPACFGIMSQLSNWQEPSKGKTTKETLKELNIFKQNCEDNVVMDKDGHKLSLCKNVISELTHCPNAETKYWDWNVIQYSLNYPDNLNFDFLRYLMRPVHPDLTYFLHSLETLSDEQEM